MTRKIKCLCRYLPQPGHIREMLCDVLADGTVLPPARWELLDQADETCANARATIKPKSPDLPGQQLLPGIEPPPEATEPKPPKQRRAKDD